MNNILDIFFTNRPSLVRKCYPLPGISDHEIIFIESSTEAQLIKTPKRKILIWSGANITTIKSIAQDFNSSFLEKYSVSTPVNILWNDFKTMCLSCLDHVPTRSNTNRCKQPWVSSHIRQLSRRKQRMYNLARSSQSPLNWQKYHQLKKETQKECRKAYTSYVSTLVNDDGHVSKRLWTFIKSQRKDHCGVAPLKHNNNIYSDTTRKIEILNEYFTSVFTYDTETPLPSFPGSPFPDIPPITINCEGVTQLLATLDVHKATGPDHIPAHLLKEIYLEIAPSLTLIFQASVYQCSIPYDWKVANITPLFKKGDHSLPGNYRPISLTSICCKLLEHIIYSHIFLHLNQHNILCDQQHGFRNGRSCETQLIITVDDFAKSLDEGGQTDVVLLDFSKAFDKVSHKCLLHKLNYYGIRGNLLAWLENFLSNRIQRVVLDGEQSQPAFVTSGVPQGTVLAPLLFLCFINDLPDKIKSRLRLYADDVLLYSTIKSLDDCHILQEDLNTLNKWAQTWKMTFNASKCEFLRVTKKLKPILMQYHIQDEVIKEVKYAKYLGVIIDHHLSWNDHINYITSKANNVKCFLQRNLSRCSTRIKSNCYQSIVRPILEYACTVWAPHTQKNILAIEAVQRRAARYATNNYSRYASVSDMLTYLQWPTLNDRREKLKIIMLYKIMQQLVEIPRTNLIPALDYYCTRGYNTKYIQPFARTDTYYYSFFPSTIRTWNSLQEDICNITNLQTLKEVLDSLTL